MSASKRKLFVVVEGGCVQSVCAVEPGLFEDIEVILVDHDESEETGTTIPRGMRIERFAEDSRVELGELPAVD